MYLEKDIYITDIHSICKSDILDIYIYIYTHTHIYIKLNHLAVYLKSTQYFNNKQNQQYFN